MAQFYYNGAFSRRASEPVYSRGDRCSRQGRKRKKSDIGDETNPPKLASVKNAYNNLGKCVSFMPIFPIVMDTTMISLVFKYFSL